VGCVDAAAAVCRDGVGVADGNHPDSVTTSYPKALIVACRTRKCLPPPCSLSDPRGFVGSADARAAVGKQILEEEKTKRAGASFSGNLAEACISCRASSTNEASWGIHHVVNDVDVVGTDSSLVGQEIIQ
jgi:hypothetical protein